MSTWKRIQSHLGITSDGIPGPGTARAVAQALNVAVPQEKWPRDRTADLIAFYGQPGSNQSRCHVPFELVLDWDTSTTLQSFSCHEKCVAVFSDLFRRTLEEYGEERIKQLGLNRFGGCLNVRRKRGGTTWSVHAFGAAIDLWPSQNKLRWGRDKAAFAKPEYEAFWSIVDDLDLVSLGRQRNFDYMHVQAATI